MAEEQEDQNDGEEDLPPPEDGEEDSGEGKGGNKKLIIIIAGVLLLLVGGGAGAYFMGLLDGLLGVEQSEDEKSEDTAKEDEGKKDGDLAAEKGAAFIEIPPMLVNLKSEDGSPRYLRLRVQLELENEADKEAVEKVTPRVIDKFQTYLRELRVKDLRGSAGIYRLQMELLWRVNQAAKPHKIKDVLFQEILIQ